MHALTTKHMQALKHMMRYLKGTVHYGLFLNCGTSLELNEFADSDWGGDANDGVVSLQLTYYTLA